MTSGNGRQHAAPSGGARTARWLALVAVIAAPACSDHALFQQGDCFAGGLAGPLQYDYTACDDEGRVLLVGRLAINIANSGRVSGTWEIAWAPEADRNTEVGPQVGTGTVVGTLEGDDLYLDLHPGLASNDVRLDGTLRVGNADGRWSHVTLTGHGVSGPFSARRR